MSNIIIDPRVKFPEKINKPVAKLSGGKFAFIDKNPKGKRIESTAKESKSKEVEGDSRFCGKRFILATRLYGDKRCLYCGVWFHWKDADYATWIRTSNIDRLNLDDNIEPLHCGSSHCTDYHYLSIKAEERCLEIQDPIKYRQYKMLQSQKLVD